MDALYSKLYETYNQFKTKKFTEMEKLNRNQEEKFLAFTHAADELLQQYRIENDKLIAENDDLRSELALTRSSMDEKIAEYQKLLMEEYKKSKILVTCGHYIVSYDTPKDKWTLNELSSHCVQEENKTKREKTDSARISTSSKFSKRKRIKDREIAVGTLQPKKEKTYEDGRTCFFCKKSGHVKKICPKFAARRMKKGEELLQEIERLQSLQREGLCCISRHENNDRPSSPSRSQVGSDPVKQLAAKKRKCRTSGASTETIGTQHGDGELYQSALRDSADQSSKRSRFNENLLESDQPKCCKQNTSLSGGDENVPGTTICMFQELVECLVGMKVSIVTKADETCISAVHQSSGYSFSLTWMKNSQGDDELLYRVLSLGTIESIAPEWMKEILMFNTRMCPVFFERMSRVVKLY